MTDAAALPGQPRGGVLSGPATARAVGEHGKRLGQRFSLLIEIDTGSGRAGLDPESPLLIDVARAIVEGGSELSGVLTHAGHSYGARTPEGLRTRIGARILALAASVWLNHQLARPTRSLVAFVA